MRDFEPGGFWKTAENEKATLRCGSTLIHVGVPALALRHFEITKVKKLMLVPHQTARGPQALSFTILRNSSISVRRRTSTWKPTAHPSRNNFRKHLKFLEMHPFVSISANI
jgi:hypothetical protein